MDFLAEYLIFFDDHFIIIHPDPEDSMFSDKYHVFYFDYDLNLQKKSIKDQEWEEKWEMVVRISIC